MPSKKCSRLLSSPFLALLLAACMLPGASALGVTMWQAPGSGDWSHGPNWTLGEPALGNPNTKQAQINNGGTALISSLGENCELLGLGYSGSGSAGHVIMNGGSLSVSWNEYIGEEGTGSFHQSAGAHSAASIWLGNDTPNASYVMTGGTLSANTLSVGQRGAATFTHSNGQVTVSDLLMVRAGGGLTSRYDLSGLGVVDADGISVSSGGIFEQIGGSVSVEGNLAIAGAPQGIYNLAGGSLTAEGIRLGGKYGGPGQLNITNASAQIRAEYSLTLYVDAILSAVPGTRIHLGGNPNGAWFDNQAQNPSTLAGLRNVTLIYDGGEQWEWDMFEVAAADLGPTVEGYEAGFELARLAVGGSISRLRLVDYRTNQPGGDAAVYVRHLYVGPDSTLDLNGHTLYYMHADIDPAAEIILRGGALIQSEVPEPTTLALLAIGGLLLARRRR
jgi:hypothetical protein